MSFVTFIIPTMGRQTLDRAASSLAMQSDPDWKSIIVFDGRYDINCVVPDERFTVVKSDISGHAGLVRNTGIELVDTEWMVFLDDDDWVEASYVQRLRGYALSHPQIDLFVFTYVDDTNGRTVPHNRLNSIKECEVGISFAVKTRIIKDNNIRFTPNAVEDFRFINECVRAGAKHWITHDTQYHVGGIGGWLRKD
jgi:glycosyltransferase involved in cell wall biosynthesis